MAVGFITTCAISAYHGVNWSGWIKPLYIGEIADHHCSNFIS
jgi:hypothetical protein